MQMVDFLLDLCKETGLRIANGRVCDDANLGKYTFVCGRGSRMVDYVIVNPELLTHFNAFNVHDPNVLSDHCIISFSLVTHSVTPINEPDAVNAPAIKPFKYTWKHENTDQYKTLLQSHDNTLRLGHLTDAINRLTNCRYCKYGSF